mmetsp:Transcript_54674/g.155572  ORF Transcript_54674/g.155572 Transcript_54674/m.155572 type:complete len:272 (+) Transcript_54674:251-1066(+)
MVRAAGRLAAGLAARATRAGASGAGPRAVVPDEAPEAAAQRPEVAEARQRAVRVDAGLERVLLRHLRGGPEAQVQLQVLDALLQLGVALLHGLGARDLHLQLALGQGQGLLAVTELRLQVRVLPLQEEHRRAGCGRRARLLQLAVGPEFLDLRGQRPRLAPRLLGRPGWRLGRRRLLFVALVLAQQQVERRRPVVLAWAAAREPQAAVPHLGLDVCAQPHPGGPREQQARARVGVAEAQALRDPDSAPEERRGRVLLGPLALAAVDHGRGV